jgi:outer membrane lipoprotein LolB
LRAARAAAAVLAAYALLAACAHVAVETPQNDGLTFAERRTRLEAIPAWEMRGRLAVSTGERGFQGSFAWQQDGGRLDVSVHGPLGAGALEVSGSPTQLTVTTRGERHVLEDPETDLSELLGWWMPVESLPDWLLGLPDPSFPADLDFGPGTALDALDQRLWHVEFVGYELREGVLVPRRIDLSHEDLRLRLTVDTWQPATKALGHTDAP